MKNLRIMNKCYTCIYMCKYYRSIIVYIIHKKCFITEDYISFPIQYTY